jgi:predicted ATP-dependent endonuclease of OLD family
MIWGANMKLTKLKVFNYRSFGNEEQIVPINELTTFIGSNSTGKTAALCALNCIFSTNSNDRVLQRSDFHLPKDTKPDELEKQELYIEAIFTFEELKEDGKKGKYSIPPFFQSMVVGGEGEVPYLRIRLEATWEKSNNVDGSIESRVMYITCPEGAEVKDEHKPTANRRELDCIRVIYVPAVRDPSRQLKNVSGTMMHQIMSSINWSDEIKNNVEGKIRELNEEFKHEKGVSILDSAIHTQWQTYDSDYRYSSAQLRFNSTDIESSIKKSEVVFLPTVTGKEYTIDEMGDGLRSLFYISMVDSILDVEVKIQEELETNPENTSFTSTPPVLTIIALVQCFFDNHILFSSIFL